MDGLTSSGPKKLIYVGGLAEEVDQKVLNAAFIPFGDIIEVGPFDSQDYVDKSGSNIPVNMYLELFDNFYYFLFGSEMLKKY